MKKSLFIILLTLLLLLVGCSKNDYIVFSDETDNWKVSFSLNSYDSKYKLSVSYKGPSQDLINIQQLGYSFKVGTVEGERSESRAKGFPTNNKVVFEEESTMNFGTNEKNLKTIPFKIEWNNNVEELELTLID
ncbi:hypothetical protein [Bacillus sp. FJAT-29937]|uniref:hypothetical protein n=1 Tax=Bacillus sp. FJAT-29937 TaxID=1720553 RepID=UPI0008302039|nr:hypothetical protein [Bacillus sp. FJAT-29937]